MFASRLKVNQAITLQRAPEILSTIREIFTGVLGEEDDIMKARDKLF
jgi:hypothetical protein